MGGVTICLALRPAVSKNVQAGRAKQKASSMKGHRAPPSRPALPLWHVRTACAAPVLGVRGARGGAPVSLPRRAPWRQRRLWTPRLLRRPCRRGLPRCATPHHRLRRLRALREQRSCTYLPWLRPKVEGRWRVDEEARVRQVDAKRGRSLLHRAQGAPGCRLAQPHASVSCTGFPPLRGAAFLRPLTSPRPTRRGRRRQVEPISRALPPKCPPRRRTRRVARCACVSASNARVAPAARQIRYYYHRVLRKVNHLLAPLTDCVDSYDTDDVRLALLSWYGARCAVRKPKGAASSSPRPQVEHAAQARC